MLQSNPLLSAALSYAARGWRVLPLRPGQKLPLLKGWPERASSDPETIRKWWNQWPRANIGLITGEHFVVVDVDYKHDGARSIRKIRETLGFPAAPTVESPHGCHHYVRPVLGLRNNLALWPGIDIKAAGGYIVAPPSEVNGMRYQWSIEYAS